MTDSLSLCLADFDYDLPADRIAQAPLPYRDHSRLLLLDKNRGEIIHRHFYELPDYLESGDVLVLNDTRVTAIRLFGARPGCIGERVETFLTHPLGSDQWLALVRPGRKLLPGVRVNYDGGLFAEILDRTDDRGGRRLQLRAEHGTVDALIAAQSLVPLPPYIDAPLPSNVSERYQTVYAAHGGSAAAPTAGLHFTPALLERIVSRGIQIAYVTLHVGLGTFRPIQTDDVTAHVMHGERLVVTPEAAAIVNGARGRVIAVGTTSARTLESAAIGDHRIQAMDGETHLYITPGYRFRVVDALVTNFHMPRTTLLVLVSALAGREAIRRAYREALDNEYRFLSFGDAMFIC